MLKRWATYGCCTSADAGSVRHECQDTRDGVRFARLGAVAFISASYAVAMELGKSIFYGWAETQKRRKPYGLRHKQKTGNIMTTEELSQTLRKLHEELAGNPQLDESTLGSLKALLGEIQVAIDRAAGGESQAIETQAVESHEPSLPVGERLRSAILAFEARHPTLTLSLSKIADGLSSMGI